VELVGAHRDSSPLLVRKQTPLEDKPLDQYGLERTAMIARTAATTLSSNRVSRDDRENGEDQNGLLKTRHVLP
jgi:hypothetical protein